jgi:hypothetical protein
MLSNLLLRCLRNVLTGLLLVCGLFSPAGAQDLQRFGARDSFPPAEGCRGGAEARMVPGRTGPALHVPGPILVNASLPGTKAPKLSTHNEYRVHVTTSDPGSVARLGELDAYWAVVSRAVKEGDFEAYRATCHEEGVLVSGGKQTSQPLAKALARWKPEFTDTKDGKRQSDVVFRFSRRVGDATTAHETGIFRYTFQLPGQPPKVEYVHFEGLLVKKADGWKILMENQVGPATEASWEALK